MSANRRRPFKNAGRETVERFGKDNCRIRYVWVRSGAAKYRANQLDIDPVLVSGTSGQQALQSSPGCGLERDGTAQKARRFDKPERARWAVSLLIPVSDVISRQEHPSTRKDEEPPTEFSFTFAGVKVNYRSDYSEIWDTGSRDYVSVKLFGAVLHAASRSLENPGGESTARAMIDTIARHASFAVAWKRLLQGAVFNSPSLYPVISELLTVPQILSAPETTIVAGQALSAAYAVNLVKAEEATRIEDAILEIPNTVAILRYEKPESIRNRLLMCIPTDQLRSETLKTIAAELLETKQVRANEPYHRVSFGQMPFGTNEWLREQGVDPNTHDNAELLEALKPLQSFEHKYLNDIPSAEGCEKIVPKIEAMLALLQRDAADRKVQNAALGTLCAVAESILKNDKLSPDQSVLLASREIVLKGAKSEAPVFDPKYHLPFELPSWGSPLPRIESAQGLSHYLWNWGLDAEVVQSILQLAEDKVPAVRGNWLRRGGLSRFHKIQLSVRPYGD